METRLATAADAPLLAALHAASFTEGRWNLGQFADSLALTTTQAWIAEENGQARGFILYQITGDDAEVLTFCVTPPLRRKGMGQRLLATALESATMQRAQQVFLEVATDNQAAVSLYEKFGFRKIGQRVGYYHRPDGHADAAMYAIDL